MNIFKFSSGNFDISLQSKSLGGGGGVGPLREGDEGRGGSNTFRSHFSSFLSALGRVFQISAQGFLIFTLQVKISW